MDHYEPEKLLLYGFHQGIFGGPLDNCGIAASAKPQLDALASLKAKGLVHKAWALSPKGVEAFRQAYPDDLG